MVSNLLYVAAVCVELVNGLAYEAPRATQYTPEKESGWTPIPTNAPALPIELLRRQAGGSATNATNIFASTILRGSDATCGYLSGSAGAAYTCGGGGTCNFWPGVSSATRGVVACCLSGSCYPSAERINSRDYSSKCDDVCDADTYILKCTAATAPFCNTAVWGDVNVRDVYCSSRSVSTTQTFYTTFPGQQIGGVFSPFVLQDLSTSLNIFPTTSSILSSSSTTRPSSSSTTATGSNVETSTPPSFTPQKKSTPVGPIVGGVIGGVALIALAGLGIFMLRRRKPKVDPATGTAPVVHTDGHGQAPPPVYTGNQNSAYNQQNNAGVVPLPPHASEIDGSAIGKPPPMASVSEHGYFAPAPIPKPYGEQNQQYAQQNQQYGQNITPDGIGADGRRTSTISPVSPGMTYNGTVPPQGSSPSMTGRESYVSAPGHESYQQGQYPPYPPPGAHEMPGNAHEMPGSDVRR